MSTVKDLLSDVRSRMGELAEEKIRDAEVVAWLSSGNWEIFKQLAEFMPEKVTQKTNFSISQEFAPTTADRTLFNPFKIIRVTMATKQAKKIDIKYLDALDRNVNWLPSTDYPAYYELGYQIGLRPAPTVATSVDIWYIPMPTPFSVSNLTQLIAVPEVFNEAIIVYAQEKWAIRMGGDAGSYRNLYNSLVGDYFNALKNKIESNLGNVGQKSGLTIQGG